MFRGFRSASLLRATTQSQRRPFAGRAAYPVAGNRLKKQVAVKRWHLGLATRRGAACPLRRAQCLLTDHHTLKLVPFVCRTEARKAMIHRPQSSHRGE